MENAPPILIVGSGPAGLGASFGAAECGVKSIILEKLAGESLRLLASGNARCNYSNILPMEEFMAKFGRNGSFMRQALSLTPKQFFQDLLEKENVRTILEEDFYCFPASGGAKAVKEALLRAAGNPVIRTNHKLIRLLLREDNGENFLSGAVFRKDNGENVEISCRRLILASGGTARPLLGGSSDVLELLQNLGHKITPPLPALSPLYIAEGFVKELAGISLPCVRLTLAPENPGKKKGKKDPKFTAEGNLLFTHEGISGFAPLEISGEAAFQCDLSPSGKVSLFLHLFPGKKESDFRNHLDSARKEDGAKECVTILSRMGLPHALAEKITVLSGILPHTKICRLTGKEMETLSRILEGIPLTVTGVAGMDKAMVMRGGVSLKDVRGDTMESKIIKGLYFAGEILDLDGPCGGYQIQWAFSSGRLAGRCASLE